MTVEERLSQVRDAVMSILAAADEMYQSQDGTGIQVLMDDLLPYVDPIQTIDRQAHRALQLLNEEES